MSSFENLKKRFGMDTAKGFNSSSSTPFFSGKQITITLPSFSFGSTGDGSSFKSIIYKLLILLLIILIVLIVIHFTIKPIFILEGTPDGIIPVPFTSITPQGEIYWDTSGTIAARDLSDTSFMKDRADRYTVSMDLQIINPHLLQTETTNSITTNCYSLIFAAVNENIPNNTCISGAADITSKANLTVYLNTTNNDLNISVTNGSGTSYTLETIVIDNIKYLDPIRLAIVLGSNYIEVYINGKLYKTKGGLNFTKQIKKIIPPYSPDFCKIKNVQFWNRELTPVQIRSIEPSLSGFEEKSLTNISDNESYKTALTTTINNIFNSATVNTDFLNIN